MSETSEERDARLGVGDPCPECRENLRCGKLTLRCNGTSGELFMGCTRYPTCDYTEDLEEEAETEDVWDRRYEGQR